MAIDFFVLIIIGLAVIKGYQKGLVVAVFSLVAFLLGAAAALKFSGVAGAYLSQSFPNLGRWLPLLSFLLVFTGVIIGVRMLAKVVETTLKWTMLGWANTLGGIMFYALLYLFFTSIGLFYLNKLGLLSDTAKSASKTYDTLASLAPALMDGLGKVIPVFQNLFGSLDKLFGKIAPAAGMV